MMKEQLDALYLLISLFIFLYYYYILLHIIILAGLSVYNVVVLCLVGVPIALLLKDQLDASYLLISLFIFFTTVLTICLVMVPKVNN